MREEKNKRVEELLKEKNPKDFVLTVLFFIINF